MRPITVFGSTFVPLESSVNNNMRGSLPTNNEIRLTNWNQVNLNNEGFIIKPRDQNEENSQG